MYQRLQCTDNYFFKIKFVFFLYLLLSSASWKENDLSWYISAIRQTVGTEHQYLLCRFLGVSILQLLIIYHIYTTMICWRCHSNSVNTGSRLPNISDVKTRKRWNMVGIDMIQNNRISSKLYCNNMAKLCLSNQTQMLSSKIFMSLHVQLQYLSHFSSKK